MKKATLLLALVATLIFTSCGTYNDWRREQHLKTLTNDGKAQLAHAQYSREIAVAEAKAKMESSQLLAAADTIRAHGVARSNEIIGQSLNNNEAYLRWLWIDNIEKSKSVIYVPTEANLPILEANRKLPK